MFALLRKPAAKPKASAPAAATRTASATHRQQYGVEIGYFHGLREIDDLLAVPGAGRKVVLYGGGGLLPPALAEMPDRVVRVNPLDAYRGAVAALGGVKAGDTFFILLPADWNGPAAEALLDHARRWYASPHSSEDELRVH